MCFSATASFAAGGLLVPMGIYLSRHAWLNRSRFLLFAIYPLIFGIQQTFEGLLWLSLENRLDLLDFSAYGYIFFSNVFWPFWVPFSVWWLRSDGAKNNFSLGLAVFALVCGLLAYIPLLINDGWLQVYLVKHSIVYSIKLIFDDLHRELVNTMYTLVILLPLLFQSDRHIRNFGILIFISVVLSRLFFDYAFVSIWCYFAAILSLYIFFLITKQQAGDPPRERTLN